MKLSTCTGDAIITDEVGIHSGVYGDYRIKTSYEPVFGRSGGLLQVVGAAASWLPTLAGQPVDRQSFLAHMREDEAAAFDRLCVALALENFANIGIETLNLFIDFTPADWQDGNDVTWLTQRLDALEIDRTQVTCRVSRTIGAEPEMLADLANALRSAGVRLGIRGIGSSDTDITLLETLRPTVAVVDREFFGHVAKAPPAMQLFSLLLERLQRAAGAVQVDGLDTPLRVMTALDCDADLFQGEMLAAPGIAGTDFPTAALSIAALTNRGDNIAVLRR